MTIETEPLTDGRLDEAIAFMRSANPDAQATWGWDTGRFVDWRWGSNSLREAESPGWFRRHGTIVRRDGAIAAMVIAEEGGPDHCILTAAEDAGLVGDALDWLIADHSNGLSLTCSDEAHWLHELLTRHGLEKAGAAGVEWEYDLTDGPAPTRSPDGFAITGLSPDRTSDYDGITRCLQRAFGGRTDLVPVLRSLESNPLFRPELSVVARSPDGTIAAYCRGTVDPDNGVCGIDPVATDPDFQGRGLGKAVVRACFATQRRLGGRRCFIGSAPEPAPGTYLYRSLGPVGVTTFSTWSVPPSR